MEIPGYYWDESRRKYFRIQADHLVPQNVKYAKGNVRREKRSTRKRKIEDERQTRRAVQTIQRAPVRRSSIIGVAGLDREHGSYDGSLRYSLHHDRIYASQCKPERVEIRLPGSSRESRVQDAHYVPDIEQMVVACGNAHTGLSALYATPWSWEDASDDGFVSLPVQGLAAFNSSVASIASDVQGGICRVIACAEAHQAGNVFMGSFSESPDAIADAPLVGTYLTVGSRNASGTCLADSSIHPATGMAALIGSSGVFVLDRHANVVNSHPKGSDKRDWPRCAPCVGWLDANTIMYGAHAFALANSGGRYSVKLWDIRTPKGRVDRFRVRERLTGVFSPASHGSHATSDGHQILASTNHRINLFDTRMPNTRMQDVPVLSFAHVHGGPRLHGAAKGNLVAAVDANNVVQLYSTRTGTKIRTMTTPEWRPGRLESPVMRQLSWYDDHRVGLTLHAVRGNGVVRWAWSDADDENE